MRLIRLVIFVFFILLAVDSYAIYELGANFGYDRQTYGTARNNKSTSRTWGGSLAWYMFSTTALEVNFSSTESIITENETVPLDTNLSITSTQNRVKTDVYGIGIRQALLPRSAPLVPLISFGYAKQFLTDETEFNIINTAGSTAQIIMDNGKKRIDSMFATFALKIRLTQTFSIEGSINTVFKAGEWNEAKDFLKYRGGFSWFF